MGIINRSRSKSIEPAVPTLADIDAQIVAVDSDITAYQAALDSLNSQDVENYNDTDAIRSRVIEKGTLADQLAGARHRRGQLQQNRAVAALVETKINYDVLCAAEHGASLRCADAARLVEQKRAELASAAGTLSTARQEVEMTSQARRWALEAMPSGIAYVERAAIEAKYDSIRSAADWAHEQAVRAGEVSKPAPVAPPPAPTVEPVKPWQAMWEQSRATLEASGVEVIDE